MSLVRYITMLGKMIMIVILFYLYYLQFVMNIRNNLREIEISKRGVMNIVSEVADLTVGKYVDVNDIKKIEENVEKDIIGKKIIDPIERQKKLFNKIKNFFNNLLGKKDEK